MMPIPFPVAGLEIGAVFPAGLWIDAYSKVLEPGRALTEDHLRQLKLFKIAVVYSTAPQAPGRLTKSAEGA